jgi:RecJ-like exonuclease
MKCPKCEGYGKVEIGTKNGNHICFLCEGTGKINKGILKDISNCGFNLNKNFTDASVAVFCKDISWEHTAYFSYSYKTKKVKYFMIDTTADYFPTYEIVHTEISEYNRKGIIHAMSVMKIRDDKKEKK